ncbi:MAG: YebC/PmpR family DNA-binding transcriptional regulator [Candidatus Staskawiczbacteria bacterium]|nr:YebC/PmpR family DNA-binding transcriptional regulator [Candidatus Staskawiczbacteria bacterium]MBI3337000.1 YebC/PmpR family DNA-binding transcriptional regulator [Candidatus Staskawiczbacteria bacterium]
MSGHSHFKTIKAQKEVADAKRGKIFSKIGRLITIAVKESGGDPITNSKLRLIIDQAKKFNMPKENIERSIKKGTGELVGEKLEEVSFEGFGPGGISLIIKGITDNKNRTIGEIKTILNQNGGKLAGEGAVRWMFDRKGVITINCEAGMKEESELLAIEIGAQDVFWHDNLLDIYTNPENLEKIKKGLEEKQIKVESASLDWIAKEEIEVSNKEKEASQKLFEALDESDDVNDVYSNLKY